MTTGFYLILGLGVLLASEEGIEASKDPNDFKKFPSVILKCAVEWFLSLAMLSILLWGIQKAEGYDLKSYRQEIAIFTSWAGAYWIGRWRNQPRKFFLTVCALSLWIHAKPEDAPLWGHLRSSYLLSFGTALVWFWMEGLKRQIKLASVPAAVKGLPLFFLSGAILALAVSFILDPYFRGWF